ncbi:MAG: hypothetical protein WCG48_02300 [Candidatus Berkelbacteria bacterium]
MAEGKIETTDQIVIAIGHYPLSFRPHSASLMAGSVEKSDTQCHPEFIEGSLSTKDLSAPSRLQRFA